MPSNHRNQPHKVFSVSLSLETAVGLVYCVLLVLCPRLHKAGKRPHGEHYRISHQGVSSHDVEKPPELETLEDIGDPEVIAAVLKSQSDTLGWGTRKVIVWSMS